jgi:hypothetical protein
VIGLYIQFVIRTNKEKRHLPFFPTTLFLFVVVTLCTALAEIFRISDPALADIFLRHQLSVTGVSIITFYLFQENLIQYQRNHVQFAVLCSLITLHIISLWFFYFFRADFIVFEALFWRITSIPYYLAMVYVFGIFGIPIWLRIIKNTKVGIFLIFFFAEIV